MKHWDVCGRTRTADGSELTLTSDGSEYLLSANGRPLMSSRMHGSEEALAIIGCGRAATLPRPRVLVGGLGMGFTLRAALDVLPSTAEVMTAEVVPAVVEWNLGPLGALAKYPLNDPRVRIEVGDVGATMRANRGGFDAVLLDVDNGPVALVDSSNAQLYGARGVAVARASLAPRGVLAVWSVNDVPGFERRLRAAGFIVRREHVRGRLKQGGPRHTILVAEAP
ncbi:MAG: hypothetical protein ACM3NQ_03395 [Bacteroidales bacterium]